MTTTAYALVNAAIKSANYSSTKPCNSYQGFCDGAGVCKNAERHDTMDSVTDFFSNANIARVGSHGARFQLGHVPVIAHDFIGLTYAHLFVRENTQRSAASSRH